MFWRFGPETSKLKRKGYKTELVGEYAKWLWYQNATEIVEDQLYLFAEQAKEKDEQIVAILEKWQIPYTVISPWETDKVALDLKVR